MYRYCIKGGQYGTHAARLIPANHHPCMRGMSVSNVDNTGHMQPVWYSKSIIHARIITKINLDNTFHHAHVCVVFTLNRSFYSTTSVHPVSLLILHRREIQIMWSQTVRQRKNKTTAINQGKASEMLAYLGREHNKTSQTRKRKKKRTKWTKKTTGSSDWCDAKISERLQEEQHACWRGTDNCCMDETTRRRGRRYRHKAGGEGNIRDQREDHGKKNKTIKTTSVIATAFALPPLNSTKKNKNYHSL